MADIIDIAAEQELLIRESALAAQAKRAKRENCAEHFDGVHCVECEGPIPQARVVLMRVRCVGCQEDFEKRLRCQ